MVVCICTVFISFSVSAQTLTEINEIKKVGNRFFVSSGATTLEVNPVIFKTVKDNKKAYALATLDGDASATTIVAKSKATNEIVNVDSVSLTENENPRLFFSNGEIYDGEAVWLNVLPGQHVEIIKIDGLTKLIVRHHTVGRETDLCSPTALAVKQPQPEQPKQQQQEQPTTEKPAIRFAGLK